MKFWEIGQDPRLKEHRWLLLESCLGNRGRVTAEFDGGFGTIFTLDQGENSLPRYVIAKTPNIKAGISSDKIQEKMRRFLHEINETFKYAYHPLIARHLT
jgi:hypothetical protein